eukprot:TRINITY_DN2437_c1_g1_i1.p1 TRINITY_DN2437_c1_g1~~TRINITY_DN2437_c1_g1_i1.p1  ORF type:complete len:288 (-),score=30.57 TRINITY_DN2437_c1_g1_i1:41-904(-)
MAKNSSLTLLKLGSSFLFFLVGFLWDDIMTGVAMYRARNLLSNPKDNPTLPDMGFDLLPYANICKESMLPSLVLVIFMLATLFCHMIFDKQNGLVNFCRFCILDGIVMSLRATTVALTSLNNPWPQCDYCGGVDAGHCPQSLIESIWLTLQKFPLFDCGDLIFSGHTVHFLLCAFIWDEAGWGFRRRAQKFAANGLWRALLWIYVLCGVCTLIMCRFHYSVDVVVGAYISFLVWKYYDYLHLSGDDGYLARFITWIETPNSALIDEIEDRQPLTYWQHTRRAQGSRQ